MAFRRVCFFVSFLLAAQIQCEEWTVGQPVNTTSGLVFGQPSKSFPEVSEYIGIPFGQSTAGKNRFMPPKPYVSTEVIKATTFVSDPEIIPCDFARKTDAS